MIGDIIDEVTSTNDARGLSASEEVYLDFRRRIGPGLFDAGYDLLPAKSRTHTSSITGEPFTDQTLRQHILTGPAFAARVNAALRELDPENALSNEDLFTAMCLAAVHDVHKDRPGQLRRRKQPRGIQAEDKDVTKKEVEAVVETLDLPVGGQNPDLHDYHAAALAAETRSGRHRSATSRLFFGEMRHWVRLMDAAAGIDSPAAHSRLGSKLNNISDAVTFRYHELGDTKGIATNLLNRFIADQIESDGAVLLVFFAEGAVYLAPTDGETGIETFHSVSGEVAVDTALEQLAPDFTDAMVNANPTLANEQSLRSSLDDGQWARGYLSVPPLLHLFADIEDIFAAVKTDVEDRATRGSGEVSQYSIYERAIKFAIATGLIDDPPDSHVKPQTLGIFLGTIYRELLYDDRTGLTPRDTRTARRDIATAMDVPKARKILLDELDKAAVTEDSLSESATKTLADYFDTDPESIRDDLLGGVLSKQLRVETVVIALCYLDQNDRMAQPLGSILDMAYEDFFAYYHEWQSHWDDARNDLWDEDWPPERKHEQFETELLGNLPAALAYYFRRYLTIDGEQYPQTTLGQKYEQYISSSQPRVCLLCNDQLVGERNALAQFKATESHIGRALTFTHHKQVSPERNSPNSVICPMCNLELTLRNATHSPDTDRDELYLFTAPDYFHTPADVAIAEALHEHLTTNSGSIAQQAAALISGQPENRSDVVGVVLDVLDDNVEDFQQDVLNYDSGYTGGNAVGVFRLDNPVRPNSSNEVTRVPRWTVAVYTSVLFAWLTGSRVLLTDSPFPTTGFDEFKGTVHCEGVPGPVDRHLGTDLTIASLRDLGGPDSHTLTRYFAHYESGASDVLHQSKDVDDTVTESVDTPQTLEITTQFGAALYRQSALLYLTNRRYDYDLQRLKTVLERLPQPFAGAQTTLTGKSEDQITDLCGLFGAQVLDTLTNPQMRNTFIQLADAGFEIVSPGKSASNYEYGRLFRTACDTLSDSLTRNTTRDELVEIVAGQVMGDGRRARQNHGNPEYADEKYVREPAREFARTFVDDVFYDICDGDFYELRRQENALASGYNAAMREREQKFFESLKNEDSDESKTEAN